MLDGGLHNDEGRCRFNCRTAKENFVAGYEAAQKGTAMDDIFTASEIRQMALEAWDEYKEKEESRL